MASIKIDVRQADALTFKSDVLALKHAQDLYGLDEIVVGRLIGAGRDVRLPKPSRFCIVESSGVVEAASVLFLGVPPLFEFGYAEIRKFGHRIISTLAKELPKAESVALTLHGPGYGLDELEAFESELAGLLDAIRDRDVPESLKRITVLEQDPARAKRLRDSLSRIVPNGMVEPKGRTAAAVKLASVGVASNAKPHVFVAMPFKEHMEDPWELGIQPAVRSAGFVCERADLSSFAGDVLEFVRNRIKTSSYVIAILTESNPNVYLEVGYAWGVGVPTVLLISDAADLKFDVRAQRCLTYTSIRELKTKLKKELIQLGRSTANSPARN